VIAALYIDPRGPYAARPGVEAWGLPARDARTYAGPWPVVAHPPCGPWGRLKHLDRSGAADCAPWAVEAVRRFGGVLEHPRGSDFWTAARLPAPGAPADAYGGFALDVEQVAWGHVARKPTWLYVVGFPGGAAALAREVRTGGTPTHWASGRRGMARASSNVPPGIKVCSAAQRRRTPPAFAEWLISIAERCRPPGLNKSTAASVDL
jgi:hypothetical protein